MTVVPAVSVCMDFVMLFLLPSIVFPTWQPVYFFVVLPTWPAQFCTICDDNTACINKVHHTITEYIIQSDCNCHTTSTACLLTLQCNPKKHLLQLRLAHVVAPKGRRLAWKNQLHKRPSAAPSLCRWCCHNPHLVPVMMNSRQIKTLQE